MPCRQASRVRSRGQVGVRATSSGLRASVKVIGGSNRPVTPGVEAQDRGCCPPTASSDPPCQSSGSNSPHRERRPTITRRLSPHNPWVVWDKPRARLGICTPPAPSHGSSQRLVSRAQNRIRSDTWKATGAGVDVLCSPEGWADVRSTRTGNRPTALRSERPRSVKNVED